MFTIGVQQSNLEVEYISYNIEQETRRGFMHFFQFHLLLLTFTSFIDTNGDVQIYWGSEVGKIGLLLNPHTRHFIQIYFKGYFSGISNI